MSISQLKLCAAHPLITIGSHTVSHPFLSRIDPKIAEYEVANSKEALEKLTEKPVELFAYPTGDYDRSVAELAEWAGYRAAFAVKSQHLYSFRYEISRISIDQSGSIYLSKRLSGLYRRPLEPDLTLTQGRAASEKKS
jgi:peptidoglycan/xylan/chitin deacetylase (PgdA/CDA1 family)